MVVAAQFCALQCGRGGGVAAAVPSSSSSSGFHGERAQFLPRRTSCCRRGVASAPSRRGRLRVDCVGWDPENILAPPQPGHISRRSFEKKYQNEAERKVAMEEAARAERLKLRAAREARVVPTTNTGLVDFFLATDKREIEFEIARCRPRLDEVFFSFLRSEIGLLRFGVNPEEGSEDRLAELDQLQTLLTEGVEAYDKLAADFTGAKEGLTRILTSKDKRATLLEMAGENKLNMALLALLDENIAAASRSGQKEAVEFMDKIRGGVLKYMTI
ncbi:unnamed protein product [Calypogeia fissa]